MNLAELNNDQVHAVAAHLAVAEAIVQTRVPVDVKPEERRYRLRVGGKLAQVISHRTGDWQITDATRPLLPDPELLVLVDFIPDTPEFYVVPAAWFCEEVAQRYAAFLERVGTRPRNPASKHHNVHTADVVQWRGRWDVVQKVPA